MYQHSNNAMVTFHRSVDEQHNVVSLACGLDDKLKKAPQVIIYYACNLNGLSFSLCAVYENNITLIRIEVLHRQMCSALTARLFAILIMCIVV